MKPGEDGGSKPLMRRLFFLRR
jgi:hypothetical protein